ncbi:MAG: hypothetical protein ACOC0T_00490 [Desulfovermiculus sp.]
MMSPYEIVPVLQGVPITSNRGALGWSSSTIIKGRDRVLLFDTGSCGDRQLFLSRLADHGFSFEHNTPPPCFGLQSEALASMHRIRTLASTILPGHDIPFSLAPDGSTQPQGSPFPLHITISSHHNPSPQTQVR